MVSVVLAVWTLKFASCLHGERLLHSQQIDSTNIVMSVTHADEFISDLLICPYSIKRMHQRYQCQIQTGIHRHQSPSRYRHAVHGNRCPGQPPPFSVAPITAKRDVIHKTGSTQRSATPPEEDRAAATGDQHKISCRSVQRFQRYVRRQTDAQTDTYRQTDKQTGWSQYSAPLPGPSNEIEKLTYCRYSGRRPP